MSSERSSLYIGGIVESLSSADLHDLFAPYGTISRLDIKIGRSGINYAFLEYAEEGAYLNAMAGMDSVEVRGSFLKVKRAEIRKATQTIMRSSKQKGFRVIVSDLDPSISWTDLKDFARTTTGLQVSFRNWIQYLVLWVSSLAF